MKLEELSLDKKVSIAATVISIIIGACFWMSSVASDAAEAKQKVKELWSIMVDTHDRVIRIEEHLKDLKE